jgi:hypothetical protein
MCCGNKRLALRSKTPLTHSIASPGAQTALREETPAAGAPSPISKRGPSGWAMLRYKEGSAVRVRGPVTGRRYEFSILEPMQSVDPRDAAPLTHSGMFLRV